MNHFNIILPSK